MDVTALLDTYDAQLRGAGELPPTARVVRHGPLFWGHLPGGSGFVSYHDLAGATGAELEDLVAATVAHYRSETRVAGVAEVAEVAEVEWKTCGHDDVPDLHRLLLAAGFRAEEAESVMIGPAAGLAAEVPLPAEVTLRRVVEPDDVRRLCAVAEEAFGAPSPGRAAELLARLGPGLDELELWVAEVEGRMVSVGRLEPVAGSEVAGLWGGATLPAWRGRGLYRALTAARARSALRGGRTLLHSDSTPASRPILERSGLVHVTTTTPYVWSR